MKEKFGTRDKLVSAVLELEKRSKDTGMQHKLSEWPVPRLWDAYRSAAKRKRRCGFAPKAAGPASGRPRRRLRGEASAKSAKPARDPVLRRRRVRRRPEAKKKPA